MAQSERGSPMGGVEAYTPAEIARMVETKGVAKAGGAAFPTFVLGVLAGAFIAFGAVLSTIVATGSEFGFGPTRWLAGLAFSLGLILVVVAGAELFTGNNLVVMSLVDGHITLTQLLRNWGIVFVGNFVGAVSIVVMVWLARGWELGGSEVGVSALSIAATKTALPFGVVFVRGILCNVLVCLAVWLAMAGKTRGGQGLRDHLSDRGLCRSRVRALDRQHVLHSAGNAAQGRTRSRSGRSRGGPQARAAQLPRLERVGQQHHRSHSRQHRRRWHPGGARVLVRLPPPGASTPRKVRSTDARRDNRRCSHRPNVSGSART